MTCLSLSVMCHGPGDSEIIADMFLWCRTAAAPSGRLGAAVSVCSLVHLRMNPSSFDALLSAVLSGARWGLKYLWRTPRQPA